MNIRNFLLSKKLPYIAIAMAAFMLGLLPAGSVWAAGDNPGGVGIYGGWGASAYVAGAGTAGVNDIGNVNISADDDRDHTAGEGVFIKSDGNVGIAVTTPAGGISQPPNIALTGTTSINNTNGLTTNIAAGAAATTNIGFVGGTNNIYGTTGINVSTNNATNINTGTSTGTVTVGNSANTTNLNSATNNIGVSSGYATANNIGTNAAFASTNRIGNTNAGTTTIVYSGNSTLSLQNNSTNSTVTGGVSVLPGIVGTTTGTLNIINNGFGGATESQTALTFQNGYGNTNGLQIYENRTALSGGTTNATTMTLNDSGARFANPSGGPVRVTGVADGSSRFDAVNYGQLSDLEKKAFVGISSAAALAAIPGPDAGKRFSIGLGWGNYQTYNGVAVGAKARLAPGLIVGAGYAFNPSSTSDGGTANAGISFSW